MINELTKLENDFLKMNFDITKIEKFFYGKVN